MALYSINLTPLNAAQVKADILNDLDDIAVPAQTDVEQDLQNYYDQVNDAAGDDSSTAGPVISPPAADGKSLLQQIKGYVCNFLKGVEANNDNTLDAILAWVESFFGGIILKAIVGKIVKFLVNLGITAICGA